MPLEWMSRKRPKLRHPSNRLQNSKLPSNRLQNSKRQNHAGLNRKVTIQVKVLSRNHQQVRLDVRFEDYTIKSFEISAASLRDEMIELTRLIKSHYEEYFEPITEVNIIII